MECPSTVVWLYMSVEMRSLETAKESALSTTGDKIKGLKYPL
jgi:hypothetical protein